MSRPSFPVVLALIVLWLSALYAVTFSHMLYVSLQEQVFSPPVHLPRYAGQVHHHNALEWVLILAPAIAGWFGVVGSTGYLVRRRLRPTRSGPNTSTGLPNQPLAAPRATADEGIDQ